MALIDDFIGELTWHLCRLYPNATCVKPCPPYKPPSTNICFLSSLALIYYLHSFNSTLFPFNFSVFSYVSTDQELVSPCLSPVYLFCLSEYLHFIILFLGHIPCIVYFQFHVSLVFLSHTHMVNRLCVQCSHNSHKKAEPQCYDPAWREE